MGSPVVAAPALAVASGRAPVPAERHGLDDDVTLREASGDDFLREATRHSLKRAGLVRIGLFAVLYITVVSAAGTVTAPEVVRQVEAAQVVLLLLGVTGAALHILADRRIGLSVLPYATVSVDALAIIGNLFYNHWTLSAPGGATFLFPVVWVIPIALAANAIYYRPGIQIFATVIYMVGLGAVMLSTEQLPLADRAQAMARFSILLGGAPNWVRLVMLLGVGVVLILAARQGQLLLGRAVRESAMRANLTRYLPAELAPVLSAGGFDELRRGRRITVALLFVDIRGSTALGAGMTPAALARFITAFRQQVGASAEAHGGVIDKFIGDGALIVFGVPDPRASDASRALACAQDLHARIVRWGAEGAGPAISVGIGVHCGEVFCGVLGEESRLEFTVLGDAVNVAARLEQATKTLGGPILASAEVVESAGATGPAWREVSREPLPGVPRRVVVLAPAGGRTTAGP